MVPVIGGTVGSPTPPGAGRAAPRTWRRWRRAIQAAGLDLGPHLRGLGPHLRGGLVRRPGRPVRPGLAHRGVGVGGPSTRAGREIAPPASPRGYPLPSRRSRCCTAISPSGASAADWCSIRSVRYGYIRTRSHSPALSGPGRSQIEFDTPSRPKPCTSPARRSSGTSAGGSPSRPPASPARIATAAEWPSMNGDFRSTKFAMAVSARSSSAADRQTASSGSAPMTAGHAGIMSRPPNMSGARSHSSAASAGSNCRPDRRRASVVAPSIPPTR